MTNIIKTNTATNLSWHRGIKPIEDKTKFAEKTPTQNYSKYLCLPTDWINVRPISNFFNGVWKEMNYKKIVKQDMRLCHKWH